MTSASHPTAGLCFSGPDVRMPAHTACLPLTIEIGGLPLRLRTTDPEFRTLLAERYSSFVRLDAQADMEFDLQPGPAGPVEEWALEVSCREGRWRLSRGDLLATFDLRAPGVHVAFASSPYAVDTLLRIVHSLLLAPVGGLLLHAAGGVRHGSGALFSGVSGAGKTTLARLAPRDVQLLTDEVSYLRRDGPDFRVYGTPFAGELGISGEDVSAPLSAIYLIEHGPANRVERASESEAVRRLMRNTLFFAREKQLVAHVFSTVCALAAGVPVYRLAFVPDARVWELIP